MMKAGRILAGLCLGSLVGNITAIPFGLVIDAAYGAEVTGGQWHLSVPNILYTAIMGLLTGLAAGIISGRKGWLIGALAQFFPLTVVIVGSIIRNQDLLSMAEVPPATWTWIGLLPAIVGGRLGERVLPKSDVVHRAVDPRPFEVSPEGTTRLNKFIAKLLYGVVIVEAIAGFILGFLAYFVRSLDSNTGLYFDGLGRQLQLAPFVARFVLGTDSLWPGWLFFTLDLVVFWGGMGIGYVLITLASKLEAHRDDR
jgi:hypothetical protein